MKISIIGLGYVGLPLAMQAASKGHTVIGVDKNKKIVDLVNQGKSHIHEEFLTDLFKKTSIIAQENISSSDVYIVCVPTPVDETKLPDLTPVMKATEEISSMIEDGQLVVIESTIYPGVCDDIVKPILDKSGKKYLLAHCPERINPGDEKWNISNIPRVIGGINDESTVKAKHLYESIVDAQITALSRIKEVEATKILENTYRDINIAFVNEMAQSFHRMGIDISEVIRGASSKPFGFMPHYPGIGVGGHCIAVDPYYMIEKGKAAGYDHEFLKLARKINSNMPIYTLRLLQNELNELELPVKNTKIGIYGISYKPNVADDRESPSYQLIKRLKNRSADLVIYDPFVLEKSNVGSMDEFLDRSSCVVVCTSHDEILELDYSKFKDNGIKLIVDGRNCLDKNKIKALGISYAGLGRK